MAVKTSQCHPNDYCSRIYSPSKFCKPLQNTSKRFEMLQIALLQNASKCCEMFHFDSFTPVHLSVSQKLNVSIGD